MVAHLFCCALLLLVTSSNGAKVPAGKEFVFELMDGSDVCFYASFKLSLTVTYLGINTTTNITSVMSTQVRMPNKTEVTTTGQCSNSSTTLTLTWKGDQSDYNVTFLFLSGNSTWYPSLIAFTFNLGAYPDAANMGVQTYVTQPGLQDLFSRGPVHDNQFFYCEKCKTFQFTNCSSDSAASCVDPCPRNLTQGSDNETICSSMDMMESLLYSGDYESASPGPSRLLCLEDYIALQEIIVPVVVGGVLAVLLLVIFVSYMIAFIRRRHREGRYERLANGNY